MIIIAGYLVISSNQRDAYVEAHRDLVSRARASDGCLHVAITADSVESDRVNNVEVWRDVGALEAWRAHAAAPETQEPESVVMHRYDATDGGPLF